MTLSEIAKHRLINQQIVASKINSAVEMVQGLGAVQAQEYAQTKWALGLRLPHLKDDDVEKEFSDGKILRTHLLRPTWHFVAAEDIHWLLELTAPRVHAVNAYMYRKLELTDSIFKKCNDVLIKTLQGGKQLTRDVINEEFKKNKIIADGHRLSYIMMQAELSAIICSGARAGKQFTYALLEEKVPKHKSLNKEEALVELTKRYFLSRGPSTIKDFSTWSGLTLTDCRKGVEASKSYFQKEIIEGDEYYYAVRNSLKQPQEMYLLPIYDEFIMGYKNRDAYFQFKNSMKVDAPIKYDNMIVYEGQIIGTWKRTINNKSINLEYNFFELLNKNQWTAFEKAVERFGEFSDATVRYLK